MDISTGRKIKAIRYIRGWTQTELARAAGIGRRTLVDVETDSRISRPICQKIEAVFGFSLNAPAIEAAFAILADDHALVAAVAEALFTLEAPE